MQTWRTWALFLVVVLSLLLIARGEDSIVEDLAGTLPEGDGNLDGPIDFTNADDVMEKLGPVMMNADGSMSRIANWKELTKRERNTYLKKLAKGKVVGSGPKLMKKDSSEM
ncbi:hypothetical protein RhiJN_08669 [Ceratobasidium sp. AG-Ba]|nr:hypothetical protein RhiJN_08669 [Ceratobasidium sp. AG-Ba]QRW09447.1 hypothetical protein RhiLY_08446 [Ceratobasidium sp. AG-Ba]